MCLGGESFSFCAACIKSRVMTNVTWAARSAGPKTAKRAGDRQIANPIRLSKNCCGVNPRKVMPLNLRNEIRTPKGSNRHQCIKREDGFASLNSGASESRTIQMFEEIVDSKPFLRRLQSGNKKAFEFLYEQGLKNVVPFLRSEKFDDPEDALHDCWIELKESKCSDYDPAKGKLSNWLLAYVLNHAREVQKKRRRWQETSIDNRPDSASEDVSTEENEGGEQDKAKLLKQASRSIGKDEYRLLQLRYGLGVKSPGIAKKFGTTSAAIRKRISRALQRLREEIERLQEDELRRPAEEPSGPDSS